MLLTLLLVVLAATASGLVVYFLTGSDGSAAPPAAAQGPVIHKLADLVPAPIWETCKETARPRQGALETANCLPPADATTFTPDHLEVSTFANGAAVQRAYEAERRLHRVAPDQGRCNGVSWGGEGKWFHNPASPGTPPAHGGSRFCYFDGTDAVIVWTHRKLGQPTHTDFLGIAREGGSDHPGLYRLVEVLAPPPRQSAGVMTDAALVAVLDGADGGRQIQIAERLTVGRGNDVGLVLDDSEISRAHAVFSVTPDGLEIQDLGSLNGTWVNGERITAPTRLAAGDAVKVGTTRIEVLSAGHRDAAVRRSSPTPVEAKDELRPVSVLFADVVGSTPLAERLAPEDYIALIGGCVDRMCRAVEQFGA